MNWGQITAFGASVLSVWIAIQKWVAKVKPYIDPLIKGAEEEYKKAILDGVVTEDERKAIVMAGIKELEKDGKIKLNFISRFLISKLVDYIAKKLPKIHKKK